MDSDELTVGNTDINCSLEDIRPTSLSHDALTVTVVMTIHNDASTVEAALLSVFQQTRPVSEVIVVDMCSTDKGPDIVRKLAERHPITLVTQPREDKSGPRNFGVRHARGDLIALLDRGNLWYPTHLDALIRPFQVVRHRPLGWTYGNIDEIDCKGRILVRSTLDPADHPKADIADCLRQDMQVPLPASLIARRALEAIGGFDEALGNYVGDDVFTRLLHAGYDSVFLDVPLTQKRVSTGEQAAPTRRIAYTRKLMDAHPDQRELIASRFVVDQLAETRQALAIHDDARISHCLAELDFLERYLGPGPSPGLSQRELLITVVIPLYNGGRFIEEALRSVFRQTRQPDEVIVVNDGSTDDGSAIVQRLAEEFPIRLIDQANAGQSAARNRGVDQASGDLIAFLDQDDVWYPNHLERLLEPYLENRATELGWSYSDLDEIDEQGGTVILQVLQHHALTHPKRNLMTCLAQDMFILPSASLVSRRAFRSVGGFDDRLSGYEDDDLFMRLFRAGFDNAYIPESLSKWRIYRSSSSYSPRMAISREIYARMLISRFPNDPESNRYFVRDLIAPRFFRQMSMELCRAVLKGTREQRASALANLTFISDHLRFSLRIPIKLVILPTLRIRPVARFVVTHRRALLTITRRFLP
ncbi:MAG TPA: glycosyltransferase family A protein [Rhodopila sp.]|uniref:glycosyltransferase family 2 protein n=1 Tax=Rhodopila sp. TaxID=2480087 RepID=UPI002B5B2416|nr:glycosyltransferase family A protein [Rhodopila sp.]HVY18116.1 glycosyltransferase family A protein [Rhodopila sp.]